MTIYRTLYYCPPYIHIRRESLFYLFFFLLCFLSNKPKGMQRGRGGSNSLFSSPAASTCQSGLFTGLTSFTELMNHESVDRWVSQAVFRSHVSMWLHAAFPWCWYAYVSLSPVCFPQLIYFTMALWKVLVAATLSLPHSFTSPTIYYYLTFLVACWFFYIISGIWSKEQPGRRFQED